jgi:hypothetical protein
MDEDKEDKNEDALESGDIWYLFFFIFKQRKNFIYYKFINYL